VRKPQNNDQMFCSRRKLTDWNSTSSDPTFGAARVPLPMNEPHLQSLDIEVILLWASDIEFLLDQCSLYYVTLLVGRFP